jgi:hypothetical protein
MRYGVVLLGLLAGCTFDGGVPNLLSTIDAGPNDIDAAPQVTADASVDPPLVDAAPGVPDAGEADAGLPPITYSLVPTGAAHVVADFGGSGGGDFDEDCMDGRVVTGLDGDNTSNGVCRVRAFCSLLTANPDGSVVTSDPVLGPLHGSSGSFFLESPLNCPDNSVVVAVNGRVDAPGIVREFQISCAPLSWDYGATSYAIGATTQVSANIGSGVGTASSGACPAGEVAGGFGGNAGTLLDRFELHCFALAPVAQ